MEILDIVDENDQVIWQMDRKESYKKAATNRIVSVLIFNSEWKLALQQRSKTSSFMPWVWAISAAWHVSSWETYLQAAKKELKEKLWIECKLRFVGKVYEDRKVLNQKYIKLEKSHFFFEEIYQWIYDWDFDYDKEENDEVDNLEFFSFDEIKEMIEKEVPMMWAVPYILNKFYF